MKAAPVLFLLPVFALLLMPSCGSGGSGGADGGAGVDGSAGTTGAGGQSGAMGGGGGGAGGAPDGFCPETRPASSTTCPFSSDRICTYGNERCRCHTPDFMHQPPLWSCMPAPGGASGASGGASGTSGTPGSAGTSGTPTAYPAGPRRMEPGDEAWPQLAYSPVNTGTTSARIPDVPMLRFDTAVDGEIAYTTPVVGDGKLFYELYPGGMVALHAGTGAVLWQNKEIGNGKYGTAAYADGRVFTTVVPPTTTFTVNVVALDAGTGQLLWSAPAPFSGILKVDRGTLYFTVGHVVALDASTGESRWTSSEPCDSPPAIEGDRVYCLGTDRLVVLDAAAGSLLYTAPTPPSSAVSSPAVSDGRIFYVGDRLYARATADGAALWDADFGAANRPVNGGTWIETSPAVAYGKVFVVGAAGVYAFDAGSGARLWQTSPPAGRAVPGTSVAVADGRVVVSGSLLLNADDGRVVWSAPSDRVATSTPVVTDGHFYGGQMYMNRVFGWGGEVPGVPPAY